MKRIYASTIRGTAAAAALALISAMPAQAASDTNDETPSFEEIRANIGETFDAIAEYSAEQRDEALESTKKALAEADAAIERVENDIRENWHEMTKDMKIESGEALRDLRRERTELAEEYGAMKSGSDEAWDDLVNGFTEAWEEFETAWEKAAEPRETTN